jgi:broad specificity phosphatase PhoE
MPDGEHLDDVIARAQGLVKELIASGPRRVLLVSHGSFLRILASQWIHQDAGLARHLKLGTARIGILGLDQDRPMIERWNL